MTELSHREAGVVRVTAVHGLAAWEMARRHVAQRHPLELFVADEGEFAVVVGIILIADKRCQADAAAPSFRKRHSATKGAVFPPLLVERRVQLLKK